MDLNFKKNALLKQTAKSMDKSGVLGNLLIDLSNVYDCLPYELFLAKLSSKSFDKYAIALIESHFSNRYEGVKIVPLFNSYL